MPSVSCELPWPPSANHAWRSVAGKVHRSEDYRLYKKAVGDAVLEQCVRRFQWTTERLAFGLICHPPNPRTFDIDNRVKTVLDSLAAAGVIANDKYVDLIVIARGDVHAPHGAVLIHIEECSASSAWQWLIPGRRDARAYSAAHGQA
jgi:crossover junction endodeoxyribonuclease RusA